ncbi:hypothetical protein FRC06_008879 [Ceratobasidium sp. 370]|nr:hypothetical protein FRC06_008879 [Ceratobasidium sp. 370]
MVLPEALQTRVTRSGRRLHMFMNSTILDDEEDEEKVEKGFLKDPSRHKIIDEGIEYACGESAVFDFVPSWVHDNDTGKALIEDAGEARLSLRE